jgi:cell wall-associated NlpC family hydrolase
MVRFALPGRTAGVLAAVVLLLVAVLAWPGQEARAASEYGRKALAVAASKRGAPYAYGAAGPDRFDCSGLMLYSFRRAGTWLPRTAEQQYERTSHISRSRRTLGDLVFFPRSPRSRYMSHVGIYAGRGRIWHAPRPGGRVRLERIWTRNVRYGRLM